MRSLKVILATGIYPPQIGGPATYVKNLAEHLHQGSHKVTVISYGEASNQGNWSVVSVPASGGPLLRYLRYARQLKIHGKKADIIYCFSSVSTGLPLILTGLRKPKRLLRLGGDWLWERYTDLGGKLSLSQWYKSLNPAALLARLITKWLLHRFNQIVFSTAFQQDLYKERLGHLPANCVIENAVSSPPPSPTLPPEGEGSPPPPSGEGLGVGEGDGTGTKLLYIGRFVNFKNLPNLIRAMSDLKEFSLTLVGDGPRKKRLELLITKLNLGERVTIKSPVYGAEKQEVFADHNLLVLPSLTEISPNVALEAATAGLPVLLAKENGLSPALLNGMVVQDLQTPYQIVSGVRETLAHRPKVTEAKAQRSWGDVTKEHLELFKQAV